MTRRRGATAIASNPVLVGVATTLVIVVAVFLAYNANAGLPWVPTYRLTAEVPRASSLVKGNEVRIGGLRVGVVDKITPVAGKNGTVMAKLDLKLETRIRPLPVDSTIIIRPRSALGLKYVEVTQGTSSQGFAEGSTIPLKNATPEPVDFDEFFNMFDKRTRVGEQQNLRGFGDAFAGRGTDLNHALQTFVPLVANAVPVLTNIAAPETELPALLRLAGARRDHRRAGGSAAGRAVGQPRPHAGSLRGRRPPVPAGHDLEGAKRARDRDRHLPEAAPVLQGDGRVLRHAAARRAGPQRLGADARERVREGGQGARRDRRASTAA